MYARFPSLRSLTIVKTVRRFNSFQSISQGKSLERCRLEFITFSPKCPTLQSPSNVSPANPDLTSTQLSYRLNKLTLASRPETLQEYRLPSLSIVEKTSILDSLKHNHALHFPMYDQLPITKSTPSAHRIIPVTDPNPLQAIVDQGVPVVKKEARKMSTIRIRHKKMKKHQLRRLRKRMRFLMRKLRAVKEKKKEKVMQEYEKAKRKWAQDYDAERVIDEHLEKAREAGWGIDILAERAERKGTSAASSPSSK